MDFENFFFDHVDYPRVVILCNPKNSGEDHTEIVVYEDCSNIPVWQILETAHQKYLEWEEGS